jgi:hypothetical protein
MLPSYDRTVPAGYNTLNRHVHCYLQCSALQSSTVFYFAGSPVAKRGDTANLLDSNEMIYKLLDSNDSEFLDTDESSDTDFGEQ